MAELQSECPKCHHLPHRAGACFFRGHNVDPCDCDGKVEDKPVPVKAMRGYKTDEGKERWDLLVWRALREVVGVFTFSTKKYPPGNWKYVDNARERYIAAILRHFTAWVEGERNDPESGRHHLAHAITCLMFLIWFDLDPTGPACLGDVPFCDICSHVTVRNNSTFKCLNCGNSMGCS